MFEYEQAACQTMDTILKPTTLNRVYTMKIRDLTTSTKPLESSHKTKAMVLGAIFDIFDSESGLCEGQCLHEWVRCDCVCWM